MHADRSHKRDLLIASSVAAAGFNVGDRVRLDRAAFNRDAGTRGTVFDKHAPACRGARWQLSVQFDGETSLCRFYLPDLRVRHV